MCVFFVSVCVEGDRRERDGRVKWISEKRKGRDGRGWEEERVRGKRDEEENEDEYGFWEVNAPLWLLMRKYFSS